MPAGYRRKISRFMRSRQILHRSRAYQICARSELGMFWAKIAKTRRMIVTDVFSAKGAVQLLAWGNPESFRR